MMAQRHLVLAAALGLLLAATTIDAGCYGKNKHLKKFTPKEQRYWNHRTPPALKESELPTAFDWSNISGINWLQPSWNQHIPVYCGSCFLHATLSMIQDRLKIHSKGKVDIMLGRQTFLNCAPLKNMSEGCDGGDVIDVVRYMAEYGLPDESCRPYAATDYRDVKHTGDDDHGPFSAAELDKKRHKRCDPESMCMNCMPVSDDPWVTKCWAVKTPVLYKLHAYGQVGPTVDDMMSEIYHNGPITCSISCPNDFVWKYDGNVYNNTIDDDVDHDVEIVGWGEENGVKFWHIRNSWGTYWGKLGFFKLQRGINSNMIEAGDCWYADPSWEMQDEIEAGEMEGSMDGVRPRPHYFPTKQQQPKGAAAMRISSAATSAMGARAGSSSIRSRKAIQV